jgi:hypothetical protein
MGLPEPFERGYNLLLGEANDTRTEEGTTDGEGNFDFDFQLPDYIAAVSSMAAQHAFIYS